MWFFCEVIRKKRTSKTYSTKLTYLPILTHYIPIVPVVFHHTPIPQIICMTIYRQHCANYTGYQYENG